MSQKSGFTTFMKTERGFTLIELMVVIAIIAILATIGVLTYSGIQASARDSRRKAEIYQIAQSTEVAKDIQTKIYKYTSADGQEDFQRPVPDDPGIGTYCINTSDSSTTPPDTPTESFADCDAIGTGWTTLSASLSATTGNNLGAGGIKSWTLCATLERSLTPFCVKSLTR